MITKELGNNKMCLFCASDYHLEMILLPYIQERLSISNFAILTQTNLEITMQKLLNRVNIDKNCKEKIWNLNWKEKTFDKIENFNFDKQENTVIINGDCDYIKKVNSYIKKNINKKITIIDCFHVGDINVSIDEISKEYDCVLNTRKINQS